jgi:hypothetical protein
MARSATTFVCSDCGHQSPKWLGRCPGCGEWNSLHEEVVRASSPAARRGGRAPAVGLLGDVDVLAAARLPTGVGELDRVLGGGLVPGSLVLIGGEHGHDGDRRGALEQWDSHVGQPSTACTKRGQTPSGADPPGGVRPLLAGPR